MTKKVKMEADSILKPPEKKPKLEIPPAESKLDKEIKAADDKIKKLKDAKPVDPGLATESKELVNEAAEKARDKELEAKKEEIKQLEKDEKADKLEKK